MISVLIADDSFLMRTLIGDILKSDPEITVVGSVGDGKQAIEAAERLKPDVITMDLEMPTVDGLSATKRIMEEGHPSPIVVMVSAFSADKAGSMIDCLCAGAFDCVRKPSGSVSLNIDAVGKELIQKVKAAARAKTSMLKQGGKHRQARHATRGSVAATPSKKTVIVIGSSTGGPVVLETLLASLPEPLAAIVLIAQHIPESFTTSLADRLDRSSPMPVVKVSDGDTLRSGTIALVRGDGDTRIVATDSTLRIRSDTSSSPGGLHPSIDALMESVAAVCGSSAIGVLMTGMGNDGTAGMRAIKKCGGQTIVQDPATCVVDSMVKSVIAAGCADETLSPHAIAVRLRDLTLA